MEPRVLSLLVCFLFPISVHWSGDGEASVQHCADVLVIYKKKKKPLKTRVSCREEEIGGGRKQIGTLFLAGWRKVLAGAWVATVYTYTFGQWGHWGPFSDLPPEKTADQMWKGSTQETPAASRSSGMREMQLSRRGVVPIRGVKWRGKQLVNFVLSSE